MKCRAYGLLLVAVALVPILIGMTGCDRKQEAVQGFVLPRGDVEAGKTAFVYLGCHQCHNIADTPLPAYAGDRKFDITLGGKVLKVKSYGDLLTAVVHPDHEISRRNAAVLKREGVTDSASPMPDTTAVMTVAQLIDIVEFLHSRYEETTPQYQGYRYVY